jgi:microcystin-dependent protein
MFQFPANPAINQQFSPVVGVTYFWNGTGWIPIGNTIVSLFPPGIVMPYAGVVNPMPFQGWLPCDGNIYSIASQPALYSVIGFLYGGNGSSTFGVPDLRGRVIAGTDNMITPTGAAGRLTGATGFGIQAGNAAGAEQVAIAESQMPSHVHGYSDSGHAHGLNQSPHTHGLSDPGHAHAVYDPTHTHPNIFNEVRMMAGSASSEIFAATGPGFPTPPGSTGAAATGVAIYASGTGVQIAGANPNISVQAAGIGIAIAAAGGGAGHANVQPTIIMNYIIKT